jgi:hypothetical protein
MGVMRFLVHPPSRITEDVASRIYMTGLDRVPWPARIQLNSEGFTLERAVNDSGNIHVPWNVPGHGLTTVTTGSLMERERPYHLEVELARGKVNQVRSQLAEWQSIGLLPTDVVADKLREAIEQFAHAATSQHDPPAAAQRAQQAIESSMQAALLLGTSFTEQALAARFRQASRLTTHLGANLPPVSLDETTSKLVRASFNAGVVNMGWRELEASQGHTDYSVTDAQVQWCQSQGMAVYGGPLVRLDNQGMPDWLYLWEGDFENILSFLGEHVENTVARYRGKVHAWLCASRVNIGNVLGLRDVDKQRLAVRAIEVMRKTDPRTPAVLVFDQPWAEYMRLEDVEPPLYFADLLARAGIGLSGIGLEVNLGYYPGGSYPHDILDFSGLIDRWSLLGLPLYVLLTVPSSDQPDALARNPAKALAAAAPGGCTQATQNLWVNRFVPMLLAKPIVQAVLWNQLLDSQPHEYAHGGLFDAAGSPKAALASIAAQRRAHLT